MYVCLCSWPDISYEYEIMMSLEISSVYSKALGHTHHEHQFGSSLIPTKNSYCILIVMIHYLKNKVGVVDFANAHTTEKNMTNT